MLAVNNQGAFSITDTEQTSVELRFASSWVDSPVQLTLGGLYWNEDREVLDKNYIISCLENGRINDELRGATFGGPDVTGLCDGELGTLDSWQSYLQQIDNNGAHWIPEIEHLSAYFAVEWSISDNWTLTLENRYVDETQDLNKPNFSSCTNLAFGIGAGLIARPLQFLDEAQNPGIDNRCTADQFDTSTGPIWFSDLPAATQALYNPPKSGDVLLPGMPFIDPDVSADCRPLGVDPDCRPFGNVIGSTDSSYNTPKVTLQWQPTDDLLFYTFWARAQKPAGINVLASGSAAVTIDEERFASEKMDTYEFGWKTAWEAAGYLQLNGAVFLNDYTDKQVSTQILVANGQGGFSSNPRVINASAAEVWGLELEATWQPEFFEGLTLAGAYTYLDTQYTDFVDEGTSFVRSALIGECPVIWKDGEETVATGVSDPNLDPDLYPVDERKYDTPQDNPGGTATGDLLTVFAPKCALPLSGHELERAPKHAFVGNVNLTRPFLNTGVDWFTQVNAIYQDERFADQDNFVLYDDYWLFDFQLGLTSENFDALVYVDNVFDDDTIKSGGSGPDFGPGIRDRGFPAGLVQIHFFGGLPDPRRVGFRLNYRFN